MNNAVRSVEPYPAAYLELGKPLPRFEEQAVILVSLSMSMVPDFGEGDCRDLLRPTVVWFCGSAHNLSQTVDNMPTFLFEVRRAEAHTLTTTIYSLQSGVEHLNAHQLPRYVV